MMTQGLKPGDSGFHEKIRLYWGEATGRIRTRTVASAQFKEARTALRNEAERIALMGIGANMTDVAVMLEGVANITVKAQALRDAVENYKRVHA